MHIQKHSKYENTCILQQNKREGTLRHFDLVENLEATNLIHVKDINHSIVSHEPTSSIKKKCE